MVKSRALLITGLTAIIAAIIFAAYAPGLSSSLQFDDRWNLNGLTQVKDWGSALHFVFSGQAGPTGRPLSLLSFLPQAQAWPDNPRPFLASNVAIHLMNGLLVGLLSWLIFRTTAAFSTPQRAPWAALAVAAIWLALPLLASSNLFVIQRMTTLATLFVLVGLCFHILGRIKIATSPIAGMSMLTLGLLIGLGLGVLAKENAAVYPLLVLALDRTLMAELPPSRLYRRWRIPFVLVPAAMVLGYMLHRLITGGGFDHRHFDMAERLLTQGVVLFEYLRLTLLPLGHQLGPFHDHYPIYGGFPVLVAVAATLFWVATTVVAITYGRRWPIPAFAALWFLGSHFIESTWLPLELYYEHRNYLPAVGLVLALVLWLGQISDRLMKLAYAGLTFYFAALTLSLVQVAALWGNPRIAAEIWWDRNPESVRATQFLANYHISEGFPLIAAGLLDRTSDKDPTQLILPLNSMRLNCVFGQHERTLQLFTSILERAPKARYVNQQPANDAMALDAIFESISANECTSLDFSHVTELADAFLTNPAVQSTAITVHIYYLVKAKVSDKEGDFDTMMEYMMAALERYASIDTARVATYMSDEIGRDDSLQRIRDQIASEVQTLHPLKRRKWVEVMNEIENLLRRY